MELSDDLSLEPVHLWRSSIPQTQIAQSQYCTEQTQINGKVNAGSGESCAVVHIAR